MEGPCETSNSSPKWQNLKFPEISVWKRVSDHFQVFCRLLISSSDPIWTRRLCGVHASKLKPMRNFAVARAASPTLLQTLEIIIENFQFA